LRQEASQEQISPEELAHRLMHDALQQRAAAKLWHAQNRRRLELIARKRNGLMSAADQEEFRQLQSLAYRTAAPFDQALLRTVAELRQEMEQLPEEPVP
jgi:hypothetical protein